MTVGSPLVPRTVLVELRQRLLDVRPSEASSKEAVIVLEELDEDDEAGDTGTFGSAKAAEPVVLCREDGGAGCKLGNHEHVGLARQNSEAANGHILKHLLAKWAHECLLLSG